ncbi:MAG: TMEM175 family protein [Halobacteriota archaeon]
MSVHTKSTLRALWHWFFRARDKTWTTRNFSDAIFAVAVTLLVFSFPFSDLRPNIGQAEVEGFIMSLGTQFETFVISFVVVGAF